MKYIFFTFEGEGLPVAAKLQEEGNEVIVGIVLEKKETLTTAEKRSDGSETPIEQKRRLMLFKNILEILPAKDILKKMAKIKDKENYFVFFDFNGLFKCAQQVKEMGFPYANFPTEQDRLFEIDRDEAKEFVRKHYPEIKIAEKHEFRSIRKAKKFLKETNGGKIWVLKGKVRQGPTIVPETNDPELAKWQLIETLDAFQEAYEEAGFILEQKISDPIEITPEKVYFNGTPLSLCLNFENKPFGCGNISIQTACAEDLVFPIDMKSRIHDIAFPPIIDKLAKKRGGLFFWDASLLIEKSTGDIYFGEFCPNRPWYNSFFTYLSQFPSASYFFEKIIKKENPFTIGTVGASAMLFNLHRDPTERYYLSGSSIAYTHRSSKNIWPWDIYKKTKKDKMRTVGYDWQLCAITGSGTSLKEAVDRLYKNISNFSLINVYYRSKSDFISLEYQTSILNRLYYGKKKKLYTIPFQLDL